MGIQKKLKNVYVIWYLLTLRRSLEGDSEKIKADQNRRIYKLMKRAYRIPIYRKKFEQSGTTPSDYHSAEDLVKFPTLTKPELREWMQKEWDSHPEKQKDFSIITTSGSTGIPLKVLYTQKERACSDANWIRVLVSAGYRPLKGRMYSFMGNHSTERPHDRDSIIQIFRLMQRKVVSEDNAVGDGLGDLIRDINEYKPDLLCLRRNVLIRLIQYAEEHGIRLHKPELYVPIGETVDAVSRRTLARGLGDGLIDTYGLNELGSFIYGFPGKPYRVVANDIAVANVYNDRNELAEDGRIIVTSLYKRTYPVINYETNDLGKSFIKDGIRFFTDITGRANDFVKHENGPDSSGFDLILIANKVAGISQFRFVEESYHDLLVELVADPFSKTVSKEEVEKDLISRISERFGDEFSIRIEWLDELPPDETGKLRCFICRAE